MQAFVDIMHKFITFASSLCSAEHERVRGACASVQPVLLHVVDTEYRSR